MPPFARQIEGLFDDAINNIETLTGHVRADVKRVRRNRAEEDLVIKALRDLEEIILKHPHMPGYNLALDAVKTITKSCEKLEKNLAKNLPNIPDIIRKIEPDLNKIKASVTPAMNHIGSAIKTVIDAVKSFFHKIANDIRNVLPHEHKSEPIKTRHQQHDKPCAKGAATANLSRKHMPKY